MMTHADTGAPCGTPWGAHMHGARAHAHMHGVRTCGKGQQARNRVRILATLYSRSAAASLAAQTSLLQEAHVGQGIQPGHMT